MDEVKVRNKEPHPFDQFKAAMRKLVQVSKAELDEKRKAHDETKPKRLAGRKPKVFKAGGWELMYTAPRR